MGKAGGLARRYAEHHGDLGSGNAIVIIVRMHFVTSAMPLCKGATLEELPLSMHGCDECLE